MPELKIPIFSSAAEVVGVASISLPCTLNMVSVNGVQPTVEEANAIMRAGSDYTRTVKAVVEGWVARLPKTATNTGGGANAAADLTVNGNDPSALGTASTSTTTSTTTTTPIERRKSL